MAGFSKKEKRRISSKDSSIPSALGSLELNAIREYQESRIGSKRYAL
jgi:hypothetical protein